MIAGPEADIRRAHGLEMGRLRIRHPLQTACLVVFLGTLIIAVVKDSGTGNMHVHQALAFLEGRLEHRPTCRFDPGAFPIASNRMSPFNSQNTFLSAAVLPDYFLFPHVGRMDDIWAAYYVQAKGFTVAYGRASVYQQRNEHDLVKDMKSEYLGYENNLRLVSDLTRDPERILWYLPSESARAFELYRRHFNDA